MFLQNKKLDFVFRKVLKNIFFVFSNEKFIVRISFQILSKSEFSLKVLQIKLCSIDKWHSVYRNRQTK